MAGLDQAIHASLALFLSMSDNLSYYQCFSRVSSVYVDGRGLSPADDGKPKIAPQRDQTVSLQAPRFDL